MAEEKKKPHEDQPFVVRDRRLFTPEGELREEFRQPAPAGQPAAPRSPAPDAPIAAEAGATSAAPSTARERAQESVRKEYEKQGPTEFKAEFETLVVSLSTQALYQLALVRDPKGPPPQMDLEGARHTIDMLGVIQAKTKGNLTAAEQQLLDQALYDLRMSYLAIQNAVQAKKK